MGKNLLRCVIASHEGHSEIDYFAILKAGLYLRSRHRREKFPETICARVCRKSGNASARTLRVESVLSNQTWQAVTFACAAQLAAAPWPAPVRWLGTEVADRLATCSASRPLQFAPSGVTIGRGTGRAALPLGREGEAGVSGRSSRPRRHDQRKNRPERTSSAGPPSSCRCELRRGVERLQVVVRSRIGV